MVKEIHDIGQDDDIDTYARRFPPDGVKFKKWGEIYARPALVGPYFFGLCYTLVAILVAPAKVILYDIAYKAVILKWLEKYESVSGKDTDLVIRE